MKKLLICLFIIPVLCYARPQIILSGLCIRVIDGDTITVKLNNADKIKVRFLGVDAPESNRRRYGHVEKFGKEAKEFIKQLLNKKLVQMVTFKTRKGKIYTDRYNRILAYVYHKNIDVCKELLIRGFAKVYQKIKCSRYNEFMQYELIAKKLKLGIWQ